MPDPELIPVEDRPVVLAVGGLDPSGGAGIVTDAAAIRACGLHPVTVLTSVAVQNTNRVSRRQDLSPELLRAQLDILAEEYLLGAVKTGMLATEALVDALADWLADRPRLPVVVDPVLRSTSGSDLATTGLTEAILRRMVPRARVLTPNLAEAAALTGRSVTDRDQVPAAAQALRDRGAAWVLIKGGHLGRLTASDYLAGPDTGIWLEAPHQDRDVRGTGCALASVLAAGLARGESVPDAARAAKVAVTRGIQSSYVAGQGRYLVLPAADPGE
jgi:hydroxymethylpyrimidine/phosphomethylpyrimidine kinase